MRKMLLTPLIVCMVALLPTLLIPAVNATKPMDVEGYFDYISYLVPPPREADGNLFLNTEEDVWWYGDIDGITLKEDSKCRVVMHSTGDWWYTGLYKVTGTVHGVEGSFVIHTVGEKPKGEDWFGQWVIISGTGGLEDLRGQGTWGGPGFDPSTPTVPGYIWYEGQIHFD